MYVHWWQWVVYGELGRVPDTLTVRKPLQDMKWDLGFGIRTSSQGVTGRLSMAYSEEDWSMLPYSDTPSGL